MIKRNIIILLSVFAAGAILFYLWNSTYRFNNWTLMSNGKQELSDLEKKIEELETKLEENKTNNENSSTSTNVDNLEKDTQIKLNDKSEDNLANLVSEMYLSRYESDYSSRELLDLLSDEAYRYIQGIPRNFSYFKEMSQLLLSDDTNKEFINLMDELEYIELNDFQRLKDSIDAYSDNLKNNSATWLSLSKEIRERYITNIEAQQHLDDLGIYFNTVNKDINQFKSSLDQLTDGYLNFKNSLMDSFDNLIEGQSFQPSYNPSTYTYPNISLPPIPKSVRTYCTTYENSISCQTISF